MKDFLTKEETERFSSFLDKNDIGTTKAAKRAGVSSCWMSSGRNGKKTLRTAFALVIIMREVIRRSPDAQRVIEQHEDFEFFLKDFVN